MRSSSLTLVALPSVALLALACGGKAVVEPPLPTGAGGGGGAGTSAGNGASATIAVSTTVTTSTTTSGCADLVAQYAAVVEKAKSCNPMANTDECSKLIPESLTACCPKQVAVNAMAAADLDALSQLREAAGQSGCLSPCDGDCPPPISVSGSCDLATSRCQTNENLPD
ncbi:MAG: hypothetical protein FJ095_11295 [Deltaproteobacteria bacterium]|nr:hypothetical protein [Deltaproteobacteria bacterium]